MDTREKVFSDLETNLDGELGIVVVPKMLMGNLSQGEIEKYLDLKGYDTTKIEIDDGSVLFHYKERGVTENA